MTITPASMLSRKGDIIHAPSGADATVMMSIEAGKYFGLNAVASRVWEALDSPKTVSQLCDTICDEFDVDRATCEADVLKFANDLHSNGVIDAA